MDIVEMLRERDIAIGMAANGKRAALAGAAARLGKRFGLGEGAVLAALLRRERLGSTGIGHGVAIPHARLGGIAAPAAMLTVLQEPVWFGSPDDDPVDLLLTLPWPQDNAAGFLPALANFCRLLRQPQLRARLRASETPAEASAWIQTYGWYAAAGDQALRPRNWRAARCNSGLPDQARLEATTGEIGGDWYRRQHPGVPRRLSPA